MKKSVKFLFWIIPMLGLCTPALTATKQCPSSYEISAIINEVINKEREKTQDKFFNGFPDIQEGDFKEKLHLKEVRFGKAEGSKGRIIKPSEKMSTDYYINNPDSMRVKSLSFIAKPLYCKAAVRRRLQVH